MGRLKRPTTEHLRQRSRVSSIVHHHSRGNIFKLYLPVNPVMLRTITSGSSIRAVKSIPSPKMRKLPSQVPDAVSRLLQSTLIVTPPVWYQPVLTNPPPVLPSRRSRPRPSLDQSSSRSEPLPRRAKGPAYRPREIVYEEDRVRRQFFRDFPFEAMRPASLVEGREVRALNEVEGPSWTSLEQRGSYPSVEE